MTTDQATHANIGQIYQDYLVKLAALEKKRDLIISAFVKTLEKERIDEIKKNLSKTA